MQALLARLNKDHGNVARLLDLLDGQCRRLKEGGGFDQALTSKIMRYMTQYQDVFHHPLEDLVFARLSIRSPESVDVVAKLNNEHQELGAHGARLYRGLQDETDGDHASLDHNLFTYVDRLRQHMEIESRLVFPRAEIVLSATDWRGIDAQIDAQPDPIFRGNVEKSYQVVIESLAAR